MKIGFGFSVLILLMVAEVLFSQTITGPESIIYDAPRNRYLISNANNGSTGGSIVSMLPGGKLVYLVPPGAGIKGPKGTSIFGDTLYVSDVNTLHAVNLVDGTIVWSKPVTGSQWLNDICIDSQGNVYISDNAVNKIYKFDQKTKAITLLTSQILNPNGLFYEKSQNRILVVNFTENATVSAVYLSNMTVETLLNTGKNYLDGITKDFYGNYYISSWGATPQGPGSVYKYNSDFKGNPSVAASSQNGPADIFCNLLNDTLLIPNMSSNDIRQINISSFAIKPDVPSLIYPVDNEVLANMNINISWNLVPRARSYIIQIATDAGFTNIAYNDNLSDTSTNKPSLKSKLKYYWRVRSKNPGGESDWSSVRSFTTPSVNLSPPLLKTPKKNSADIPVKPLFEWIDGEGYKYLINLSSDSNFTGTIVTISDLSGESYQSEGSLKFDTKYWWRMKSYLGTDTSEWSETWTFTTVPEVPDVPSLNSPYNNSVSVKLTPVLKWSTTARAEYYDVYLSKKSDFSSDIIQIEIKAIGNLDSANVNNPLEENTRYYWKVRAKNTGGASLWSETWIFNTLNSSFVSGNNPDDIFVFTSSPNPVTDKIIIKSEQIGLVDKIIIFNYIGEKVLIINNIKHLITDRQLIVPLESMERGTYFVNLITGFGTKTLKFIKN